MRHPIPKSGCWILVTKPIPTVISLLPFTIIYAIPKGRIALEDTDRITTGYDNPQIPPRLLSRYGYIGYDIEYHFHTAENFAKKYAKWLLQGNREEYKFKKEHLRLFEQVKKADVGIDQYVEVITQFGPVTVKPDEYTILDVEKLNEYLTAVNKENQGEILYLSNNKALKGKIGDQIFYLRARGIAYADALGLVVGNITNRNLFYIEMHPYYVKHFTREYIQVLGKHLYTLNSTKDLSDRKIDFMLKLSQIADAEEIQEIVQYAESYAHKRQLQDAENSD